MTSVQPELSRRALLGLAGAGAVAAGVGAVGVAHALAEPASDRVDFYGTHQAGIATPQQSSLLFSSYDIAVDDVSSLSDLLQRWTALAATLTRGGQVGDHGAFDGAVTAPPDDNGETSLLPAANLTITVGFGATMFRKNGRDRFGIADQLPEALAPLPHLPLDALVGAKSDGDIGVQICADDPQVAMHAMRVLKRAAMGVLVPRWTQSGFLSAPTDGSTPRNLFGFKDGTANLATADHLEQHVWVDDEPTWMVDGSYLVARRIDMTIEVWDRTSLREQEAIVGRRKGTGAPLSGGTEFTEPDFTVVADGAVPESASDPFPPPAIPVEAHIRLAHPSQNGGRRMLRRGYNFQEGVDSFGRWAAGLFFLAYSRDPGTHVVPPLLALARHDVMNEYIRHTASAQFAVPPGIRGPGDWWGRELFS